MVASNEFHGRTRTITPQQLRDELASVIPPAVVDVRSAREYAAGRIVSAINIPLDELRASCERLPIDRPLVMHCEVGYRGYLAERALRQLGHANVRNLTGGYRAWKLMQLSIVTN
ncbi:MAG TPA: rhodanese-like domain-containing protein [Tepidisphaeraceae bacterium]|nr:rhodanese-like domain-containing protein [Tepidisphaeraceae bacterium]